MPDARDRDQPLHLLQSAGHLVLPQMQGAPLSLAPAFTDQQVGDWGPVASAVWLIKRIMTFKSYSLLQVAFCDTHVKSKLTIAQSTGRKDPHKCKKCGCVSVDPLVPPVSAPCQPADMPAVASALPAVASWLSVLQ